MPYFVFFPDCETLVSHDSGAGTIKTNERTKYWDGDFTCDWIIVGKPQNRMQINFRDNKVMTRAFVVLLSSKLCN